VQRIMCAGDAGTARGSPNSGKLEDDLRFSQDYIDKAPTGREPWGVGAQTKDGQALGNRPQKE
jgi:hypothetical protein